MYVFVVMFGTQEAACQSCINTALPKRTDIKHLGAATAVCVHACTSVFAGLLWRSVDVSLSGVCSVPCQRREQRCGLEFRDLDLSQI